MLVVVVLVVELTVVVVGFSVVVVDFDVVDGAAVDVDWTRPIISLISLSETSGLSRL